MVSVGYMDPGNWATDLAGGSRFGFALLWVVLASNLIAMLLQTLCVRLGIVSGMDLAQACRHQYKRPAAIALWLLCEIAIVACDLAEVVGSAVALNLLFGLPLLWGVLVTSADVLLLMGLMRFGIRKLEAVVFTLVSTVGLCFVYEMVASRPPVGPILEGLFVPTVPNASALLIVLGILGATVMPHNLYLHSSLVQTRRHEPTDAGVRQALRYATADVIVALGGAFFINASILVLAATVFHPRGMVVEELQQAHHLLTPLLGGSAATAFAVALLASGQSATITGTLAGQIVMEGFVQIQVCPWVRRLLTRLLAIVPAVAILGATGGEHTVQLLVASQVVLSMQLPFAVFPLVAMTSDPQRMGVHASGKRLRTAGYACAAIISILNLYLLSTVLSPVWLSAIAGGGLAFAAYVRYGYRERDA